MIPQPSKDQAIHTALTGDWSTAIILNEKLVKNNPGDLEALNRLAFAYSVLGKVKDAKRAWQKVLKLDSQNPIALKNLKKLKDPNQKSTPFTPVLRGHMDAMFLEESGKTKVIELVNIADPKTVAHLMAGELLNLTIKRSKIFVLDSKNHYLGMLPEDIGRRLIRFLKGGNAYEAYVKSIENRRVIIFVKETKRSSRFKNQQSFASVSLEKSKTSFKAYPKSSEEEDEVVEEEEEEG